MSKQGMYTLKTFGELQIQLREDKKTLVITDEWLTDYPINYGFNDEGRHLGTGYDGLFFYHEDWLDNQEEILDFINDFHFEQSLAEEL